MSAPRAKALPKSLHTVTALVRVARLIQSHQPATGNAVAIDSAFYALGYDGCGDPYGLTAMALKQLEAGK